MESRDQLLERMRIKGQETDKALREAQRRYAEQVCQFLRHQRVDRSESKHGHVRGSGFYGGRVMDRANADNEQEKSFEAERDAYRAQETHLQSRIHTLTRSSTLTSRSTSPINPTAPLPAAGLAEQVETLNEELASLSAAHCTLIAQYNTTSKEVADLKGENKRLEEENAGWELLMRDQTMSGNVKGRGLFSEDWLDEGELSEEEGGVGTDSGGLRVGEAAEKSKMRKQQRLKGRTVLESLDEEMEMGLEEGREGDTEGMQSLGSGGDLAAELGRVNEDLVQPAVVKPSEADSTCDRYLGQAGGSSFKGPAG